MDFKEMGREDVDCIDLVQEWDRWWAFVNMVINLQRFIKFGIFFTSRVTVRI
jgi:hypothetical protein